MKIVTEQTKTTFRDPSFKLTDEDFAILRSRRSENRNEGWSDEAKPYVMATLAYQLGYIAKPEPTMFRGAADCRNDPWNLTLDWLDANYPNWRGQDQWSAA